MIEPLYNRIWSLGVWLRSRAKNIAVLGRFDPALLKLAPRLIPPPRNAASIYLPSGMRMEVPPGYPAARSYSSGSYEPEVTQLFTSLLRRGMTVVDAGANVGYYTLIAAGLVAETGRVYAFEPDPVNYRTLVENVEANGCSAVSTVCRALSNTTKAGKFVRDPFGAEGFLTLAVDHPATIDVSTVTLDDFFNGEGWPPVHIIKIDIEGSEASALEGMRELSRRNPKLLLIMELNPSAISRAGNTVDAVAGLLRELGFVNARVIEAGSAPFSLARNFPRTYATCNLLLSK